jgi:Icc-related predicted phosphoesterase
MIIQALSDLHGFLPIVEPCNLLLLCGDIVSLQTQSTFKRGSIWYKEEFKPWAESTPSDKVIFIAGNHDICIEGYEDYYKDLFPFNGKVTFLHHQAYDYQGIKIFGTPYCKEFLNWAYMRSNKELSELYKAIPDNLDILITHDAPYGYTDICLEGTSEHLGNKPLADAVLEKSPRYVLHGHLHSSSHEFEVLGNSKVVNCSYINEQYTPSYKPIKIEI